MLADLTALERRIVDIAEQQGSLAELCNLVDYDPDVGRVPEHFRPRHDVLRLVQELTGLPHQQRSDEALDQLADRCWRESRYSGRDGQDFDHRAFARELLAGNAQARGTQDTSDAEDSGQGGA